MAAFPGGSSSEVIGRAIECRLLQTLLEDVRGGRSRVLVVRGESGIGKTALLDFATRSASGFEVARATGVESEMELPFAGLHQLCAPMLDRLALLPDPQQKAMSTAFGLTDGPSPDRFLIGLALLGLLSAASERTPLVCVVDDAQWLDRASLLALAFVARRLMADRIALMFAVREETDELKGLPVLVLTGLAHGDALALLTAVLYGRLDGQVIDRIVAETNGNPLALLEWPRGLTSAELAGGFGLPVLLPLSGRIDENFRRRAAGLPPATRQFLTVAAADPTGDPVLVRRAARHLGVTDLDTSPAVDAGLLEIGARVRFRHPVVRSVTYRMASPQDRQDAHRALAEATDAESAPDRRAWHLALAAPGMDEDLAAELERSAGRARARGGLAAAAALLGRSVALTVDPARRTQRTLTAAIASIEASDFAAAERWLVTVEALPLDDMSRALVDRLRGWHAHARGQIRDVPPLLLRAAKRLGPLDARAARDAHLEALAAACDLGRFGPEGGVQDAARAALAAPPAPGLPNQRDLLLDGEALMITDGFPAAVPLLSQASVGFRSKEMSPDEAVRWGGYPIAAATMLWDGDGCLAFAARWVTVAREHGAVTMLPLALNALAMAQMFEGNLVAAGMSIAEAQSINEAAGLHAPPHAASFLAALRGREADAVASIEATVDSARTTGRGLALATAQHAIAVLYNGLGRHDKALAAAEDASLNPPEWAAHLMLPEYIEAAVRIGKRDAAAATLERLAETTRPNDSDWARGIQARSEALLSGGDMAEASYREAIDRLSRTQIRPELARAHLLYGEWVRRQDRQKDAREHLRTAHEMLSEMGLVAFAERARRELISAGGAVRTRSIETSVVLTPQELQIARLATDGRSNPEIGSQLFISPRTVEWHLHKAFTKLNVTSRRELRDAMSTRPS